jgi:hypothetical protein
VNDKNALLCKGRRLIDSEHIIFFMFTLGHISANLH